MYVTSQGAAPSPLVSNQVHGCDLGLDPDCSGNGWLIHLLFSKGQTPLNHKWIHESQSLFITRKKGEFAIKIILYEQFTQVYFAYYRVCN